MKWKNIIFVLFLFTLFFFSQVKASNADYDSIDFLEAKTVEMRIVKEIELNGICIIRIWTYSEDVWKIVSRDLQENGYKVRRLSTYYVIEKK